MPEYEDTELVCITCNKPFIYEAGEQEFYKGKGLLPPKHCKPCRAARKASIAKYQSPREQEEV